MDATEQLIANVKIIIPIIGKVDNNLSRTLSKNTDWYFRIAGWGQNVFLLFVIYSLIVVYMLLKGKKASIRCPVDKRSNEMTISEN